MNELEHIHRDWLGMAQPEGLVVTASTLAQAGANLTWPVSDLAEQIKTLCGNAKSPGDWDNFLRVFLREVLGHSDEFLLEGEQIPDSLRFKIEGGELLSPRLALKSCDDDSVLLLLGQTALYGESLDRSSTTSACSGSPSQRFERLVRESGVSIGLFTNGRVFRLIHWPKGESPGSITFEVDTLLKSDGRTLLGAFHMLLCQERLLVGEPAQRLPGLLLASREYQNTVSEKLRVQVLSALRELLTGFQDADRIAQTPLLAEYLGEDSKRKDLYAGLVTVLMRMVFVLYAEERKLLPMDSELYANGYSLTQLYSQLVQDRDRHGADSLDGRYGAWARVITLFRALYSGVLAFSDQQEDGQIVVKKCEIPARRGSFFHPDRFPFVEGRHVAGGLQVGESLDLPRVSDGVVFRVLEDLLILDGERLQYKGLDVEQIGSVYEGLMGFEVEFAPSDSLCLGKAQVVVSLESLLGRPGKDRSAFLKESTGLDLKGKTEDSLKSATTVQQLHEALAKRTSESQPGLIPKGRLYLQPGEERRRTGSHYTPRKLTAPIVETTLRPVLERLGKEPTPKQLLALKVCDPAMGSGAFLVEACRQLADQLVAAWQRTESTPVIPPDEDVTLHARRLVAQQCLYGVDKNPLAVDLARLSMWLVTFAKLHPFTFVDHALRCGDSLVGLSREQLASFAWDVRAGISQPAAQLGTIRTSVSQAVTQAESLRRQIHAIGDPPDLAELTELWRQAQDQLHHVRLIGDLVIAAFFSETTDKARRRQLDDLGPKVSTWLQVGDHQAELSGQVQELREGAHGVTPFHWEIEFPEVFGDHGGFDCFVGNPPFAGKNTIAHGNALAFLDWCKTIHEGAHGNADLVAHFYRRAFSLLRHGGTFGLIATNTIAQGDTRSTGLRFVCTHGGEIYAATRRLKWPGLAAVVVSVVHVYRGPWPQARILDGREVPFISAYLFHGGGHDNPHLLKSNEGQSFQGSIVLGMGFTFDDTDQSGVANSLAEMHRLVAKDPRNAERIFPYLGGEEVNTSPTHAHHRYVIHFGDMTEQEARRWPDLMAIVEAKVKPERLKQNDRGAKDKWWQFIRPRPELHEAIAGLERVIAIARVGQHGSFTFLHAGTVFSEGLVVFPLPTYAAFVALQSGAHEVWARFFGSSMKDDLRYTPSDCFETFPFPPGWQSDPNLEAVGQQYYDVRATLMVERGEGLTKIYNRFHDPNEHDPQIVRLRELHAAMDRAVLTAYGFTDLPTACDFFLDYEIDQATFGDKKKPYRYRWPDPVRDEVLARLLDLNHQRHQAESLSGQLASPEKPTPPKPKKPKAQPKPKGKGEGTLALFGPSREEEKN